jgi:hypothetical protein
MTWLTKVFDDLPLASLHVFLQVEGDDSSAKNAKNSKPFYFETHHVIGEKFSKFPVFFQILISF